MTISLEDVAQLHSDGLLSNINSLVSLMLSTNELSNPTSIEDQNATVKKYQMMVYYADSLYEDDCFKRAERYYTDALKLKKNSAKMKNKATTSSKPTSTGLTSEVEIKYKIFKCQTKLDNHKESLNTLESIVPKQRTPKVNMALGRLYQKHGMERSALTCYKEVLRASPLALEAVECLLKLGVSLQEVISLMTTTKTKMPDWLLQYVKGFSFSAVCKYSKAIQVYKSLESQHLKENINLLSKLGESYYRIGEKQTASTHFSKLRALDKTNLRGMDIYAHILADQGQKAELEILAQELSDVTQIKTEPWVAMSYYCSCANQKARAIYFAQKAHTTDTSNVEALTLKASLLKSLNKHQESIIHFREAIRLAPNQLECYEGLVECHTSLKRNKEAMNIARNAHKTIGPNARTLALCAKVYSTDANLQEKAKAMLKKALTHDPSYLPAVYQLVELFMKGDEFQGASELLSKQLESQQTSTLHQLYADCLKETGNTSESMDQYNKALRLDPENMKALEGLQFLERDANSELEMSSIQDIRNRSSMEGLDALGSDQDNNTWMD
eukprot:TCONS_00026638-protein